MQTIVELTEFQQRANRLMRLDEKKQLVDYLAAHPMAGVLIKGSGGIRKLRWSVGVKGKSGGVRIIYYYHNTSIPLFLLSVFAKQDQINLSRDEVSKLAKLTTLLKQQYLATDG